MAGAKFESPPARAAVETDLFDNILDERSLTLQTRRGDYIERGVLHKDASA